MKHNFGHRLLCTLLSAGMLMSLLPVGVLSADTAGRASHTKASLDTVEKDFSSADGFRAVESRAKNATMTLSVGGGVLNISGRQTADGHAWNYQTIYSGLHVPVREDTKLTYIISPSGDMKDDYPSLHLAVDLKFSDGTYLSELDVEDENRVGMNPNDQGEAKAMFYGVQNVSITALGAYEQCLGKTVTDILVGYENKDGKVGTFEATMDDLRIGPSVKVYDELTDYVVTTRGTNPVSPYELSRGACHPFVALPHGFNFWTPQNVGGMGIYDYSAGYISSFRCSHQANFHLGDPAAWNFMVTSGGSGDTAFDHDDEVAQAHYYPSTTGMGGPTMINEIVQVKMGNYQHNNEPSLHIPYMYLYAGRPDRTQETVRQVLRQCYTGSQIGGGYIGDDDNGAQAAWYVFSAMGMYPLNVGSGELVFGSPLFTKTTIHLENGKDLVISAPNNSSENIYVAGLTVNGRPYNKTSILQTELTENGAVIEFEMTDKPSDWGTDVESAPTSLTTGQESPKPKADQTVEAICDGAENPSLLTDNSSATGTTLTPVGGKVSVFYSFADMQCVTMYTLTSAQDKTSAPRDFALYGSNDGKSWTLLDKREDITFGWETYTRPFAVSHADYYAEYRLDILTDRDVTLAEIELLANNQEAISRETLLGAIAHAEAKDTMGLTEAEKTQVKNAIATAKAVANDEKASKETIQKAYAQLAQELEMAFHRVSTKAELQKLHDTWASVSQGFWSNETWAALQAALTKAKGLLDSETATLPDCQNAEAAIQKAVAALAVRYDTSLSYGKEATASHSQPGEGAANALDGNTSTKWCSTSPQRGAYWLEVDLGDTYRVDGWVVMGAANEPGGTGYLSNEYRLQTKDADGKWVTVMTADPENENIFTARLEDGAVGRYFRLYVPSPACPLDGYVRIYEFHVYGEVYVPEPETEPETEPVTEPETDPETQPETDSVTEPETETDPEDVTNPGTSPDSHESDPVTEGETDTPKQGCHSAVGLNAGAALASLAVAFASKKKRGSDVGER